LSQTGQRGGHTNERRVFQVLTAASIKFTVFWDVVLKLIDVSEVRSASVMMEAVCTFKTPIKFNVTIQNYTPEDSKLNDKLFIYFIYLLHSNQERLFNYKRHTE
jgi:hypothetical protein